MIYDAQLKTRKQMQRDIPVGELGWWHDVCPGKTLEVREATDADLVRCALRDGASRNPADYLCENFDHGSLISRKAIAVLTPWTEEAMAREVRKAIQRLGAERFISALGVTVVPTYRLLERGEQIEKGDEVLADDTITWLPLVGWETRMTWNGGALMPMRRQTSGVKEDQRG